MKSRGFVANWRVGFASVHGVVCGGRTTRYGASVKRDERLCPAGVSTFATERFYAWANIRTKVRYGEFRRR